MLRTDRCILDRPRQQDCADIGELYADVQVRRYLGGPVEEQIWRARVAAIIDADVDPLCWAIRQAAGGEFIGLVSLSLHHDGVSTEISYQLLPRWWGRGYATEVVRRVLEYAFEDLGLTKIVAETQTANVVSCRLLEKVGMRPEQTVMRFGAEQTIFSITGPSVSALESP